MPLLGKLFLLLGTIISHSRNGVSLELHVIPKFDSESVPKFPGEIFPTLDILTKDENVALENELSTKIYEHLKILPQSDIAPDQCSMVSNLWTMKYIEKFNTLHEIAVPLEENFVGKVLRVFLYELTYFLNLISFETSFDMLQIRDQDDADPRILVNILGDSFLYKGKHLDQFYKQFDTATNNIGYWPEIPLRLEGAYMSNMAYRMRVIIGELLSKKEYDIEKQNFAKKMWRVACTLQLTSRIIEDPDLVGRWENEFGPKFYQAIEVGSTEVFISSLHGYDIKQTNAIVVHAMLVEVTRTDESSYSIKQFNSGGGIHQYHKGLQKSDAWNGKRYLSFVHMPNLNMDQVKNTGYYVVKDDSTVVSSLKKLYINKHLVRDDTHTDPLLYEKPQQAGTCTMSSKIFYLRSLGIYGRLFEIDFKAVLIKQLLDRLDDLQKYNLSRALVLDLVIKEVGLDTSIKGCSNSLISNYTESRDKIRNQLDDIFETANIKDVDQLLFKFPDMFTSLISSGLNEVLDTFYRIINSDKIDIAKTLFVNFLKEFEPILKSESPHVLKVLEGIIPSLYDLHIKLFDHIEFPFRFDRTVERSKVVEKTISIKMDEIRKKCLPFSLYLAYDCLYHIINTMFTFPHTPELAAVTSELSNKFDSQMSPRLSYLLLDAMRTVYGENFASNPMIMRQIAFAPKLYWDYRDYGELDTSKDCEKYTYADVITVEFHDVVNCIYFLNGPVIRPQGV